MLRNSLRNGNSANHRARSPRMKRHHQPPTVTFPFAVIGQSPSRWIHTSPHESNFHNPFNPFKPVIHSINAQTDRIRISNPFRSNGTLDSPRTLNQEHCQSQSSGTLGLSANFNSHEEVRLTAPPPWPHQEVNRLCLLTCITMTKNSGT